ncbi:co-chaperone GroES [Candidatus Roizmanbacteria bacterium CG_4_10_14_3_um_filter_39_13]|uniref:Co-chaperonin GroES n=2 Tax=Candidatus Roizmaniibacteriota TaxID=1752723 RepID=A0A2M7LKY6_9BACT|nr:MAG: co-chaperone GroES [Candidatus Roizmanbacteria bacterium CG03_land_8_20_14_0_80_39_12]PIX68724.1 MAG: co-chaperone GroES [Candidatus Roizmanbacteria bacterium CG_4_10_14_3_um_filter_39_13]
MTKTSGSKIKPLFDFVLIKPLTAESKTASGILLPDSAKEKPQVGEVMAVGPGAHSPEGKLMPMIVKVGQKVMYKKWGGNEVKVSMEEWMLVEQKDIMAIVE